MFGRCKKCDRLENENQYLRTLIDRLLVGKGLRPVDTAAPVASAIAAEAAGIEKGEQGTRFGEG